jgi:hypothetical protein
MTQENLSLSSEIKSPLQPQTAAVTTKWFKSTNCTL